MNESRVRKDLVTMLEFFQHELAEARQKRGKSEILVMIARSRKEPKFTLQNPFKATEEALGMSGVEADSVFLQAVRAGFIDADWDSGGLNADTALFSVTGLTLQGHELLGEWESSKQQPSQQFTFNAPAYGIFGSQQKF